MLDKSQILAVRTLAKLRSFRAAAQVVGVSSATFSRRIAATEQKAGKPLFKRLHGSVQLTSFGKAYLEALGPLEHAQRQFEDTIAQLSDQSGAMLRIGCGPLTTRTLIAPILADLLREDPSLRAYLSVSATAAPLDQLRTGQLDVAVCDLTHTTALDDLEIHVMKREGISFWARADHPIFEESSLAVADLLRRPFCTAHLHRHWRDTVVHALGGDEEARQIVARLPQVECCDYAFLIDLTARTDLICVGRKDAFEQHEKLGLLKKVPTIDELKWNICAAKSKRFEHATLDRFWAKLVSM